MSRPAITSRDLRTRLLGSGELALLDVREQGVFGEGHILYAACLPLSRLELRVGRLVPRRGTPVVLCDGGEGRAERAAGRLAALGYTDVQVLAGGEPAWRAAGYESFTGINVPSKAFGEYVEHAFETPSVSAEELKAMMDGGESLVVLDSRPMEEFRVMSIPRGICCPGAELVHRVGDAAPDADTFVVVNCAGRTRSIIGVQSLINAGIANRVAALRNGTMGWHLAGYELARDRDDRPPPRGEAWRAGSAAAAERVAARFGVEYADPDTLSRWRSQADDRTLYLFDVRSSEEYLAGHLSDAVHAPGGQLVQATDEYIGTLGARVALVDDDGVRATLTASWLRQMGWEAHVVRGALAAEELVSGPGRPELADAPSPLFVDPAELRGLVHRGAALVIDLADSRTYGRGHIPGAFHAVRADLAERLSGLPSRSTVVLTSPDGTLSVFAAGDGEIGGDVRVLAGGTEAWTRAGFELETGAEGVAPGTRDVWLRPYDRGAGVEAAMREYLRWEIDLVAQLERDGTARFGSFRSRVVPV